MSSNSYEKYHGATKIMNNLDIKDLNHTNSSERYTFQRPESAPLSSMRPQSSNSKSVIKSLYSNNVTRNNNNNTS